MHRRLLDRLYRHMEWADALTWRTVLDDEALARDDYILESLFHVHLVQRAHLSAWKNEEVVIPAREDVGGPAEIRDWGRAYHALAADFVGSVTETRLAEVIRLPGAWTELIEREIGTSPAPATLGDAILQVAAHSVHHRAQVSRRIREAGATPGMVDYIGWVWQGQPAADWSG